MKLVFDNERPIYIQLVEQIEKAIISGKLKPGERLLSVREFAIELKVNPNTMQKALAELEERKLIYTERTNGKFVTQDTELLIKCREKYARDLKLNFFSEMEEIGFSKEDVLEYLKKEGGN